MMGTWDAWNIVHILPCIHIAAWIEGYLLDNYGVGWERN